MSARWREREELLRKLRSVVNDLELRLKSVEDVRAPYPAIWSRSCDISSKARTARVSIMQE